MKQLLLSIACCMFLLNTDAQQDFEDLHTLYTYQKSNWDDTHATTIFLYVADTHQLQSFKWNKGDVHSALVTAYLDPSTHTVRRFENHQLATDGSRRLVASLDVQDNRKAKLQIGALVDSMILASGNWHSYDFDFASLGYSWRWLADKKESFAFHIADVAQVNGRPAFVNKGGVQVTYEGVENSNGKPCLRYKIDGEGLQQKGGFIWINPANFMIEQYKIALPDEEGFANGMLRLLKTERLSPGEWKAFFAAKMMER